MVVGIGVLGTTSKQEDDYPPLWSLSNIEKAPGVGIEMEM